jgi:hypothetical protein
MTLTERKLRKNQQDDRRFRRFARELIEEVLCFLGALAWMGFLLYLFFEAVFEK